MDNGMARQSVAYNCYEFPLGRQQESRNPGKSRYASSRLRTEAQLFPQPITQPVLNAPLDVQPRSPTSSTLGISSILLQSSSLPMATPASSATSPSPPMAYLSHAPPPPLPLPPAPSDAQEQDSRQKAVQKFLARAEISMVTRALRARLSYASYKAAHNIPHVPLRDLEAQTSQSQAASFSRTIAAKRKAAGLPNYYPTPGTPGPSMVSPSPTTVRRGAASGAMLPPSSVHSPRAYYTSINSQPTSAAHGEMASSSRSSAPNLYISILAPPPTKQARTIHNVHDPPVPAPIRPAPSPRTRNTHKSPRNEHRPHAKTRHSDKALKAANSPDRRKAKRTSTADKGKRKQPLGMEVDADGDVDMKAAATLTSLLFHHRPSIGGTSPRSSIDGSEAGSTYSYSHFAQSSARMSTVADPPPSSTPPSSVPADLLLRHTTPPPSSALVAAKQTTPRTLPTDKDSEAADLMLFLATSPSPARPSKAKDQAAFQTLSGPSIRPFGRVLFQGGSVPDQPSGESSAAIGSLRPPSTLSRSGEGSFVSSMSSIGSELGANQNVASSPPIHGHVSATGPTAAQLLPPPSLSSSMTLVPSLPKDAGPVGQSPKPSHHTVGQATPVDFNFHEFINTSPSPSRGALQATKPNHGLRADVGRRLFEEEQMRYAAHTMASVVNVAASGSHDTHMGGPGRRGEEQQMQGMEQQRTLGGKY